MKVLIKLFQKFSQWRARSPPRPPQRAKSLYGVSFCELFLCACGVKEKVGWGVLLCNGQSALFSWDSSPMAQNDAKGARTGRPAIIPIGVYGGGFCYATSTIPVGVADRRMTQEGNLPVSTDFYPLLSYPRRL
jgi:hypothetical protein